ncbi:unnamed protein product [Peronospora belbahrii]|uniref:PDZ domain-containing protein n=1 Tax=Peronospora belbahrii TaxID=622444 RepID=A0AAU9LG20_9STRA|nr:unnamed protein product [Peronospora belbahrii]CAH0516930.1 unnamed protein product [Peronospora belbahrii]
MDMRTHSCQSWSSTHQDFTSLRFFVYTGGDPGFTLTTSPQSNDNVYSIAFDEDAELRVDRVTALKVWDAGIRPGDILETVSDKRVHTMDTEAALVLVKMAKCPSIIRFRSSTSGTRVRFDVLLGRQKLGVFFTGDGGHDIPIVTRIGSQPRLQGYNRDSVSASGACLGDVLVAVNGNDAVAVGLSMTTKYLETCPRPAKLTFERFMTDDFTNRCFTMQAPSKESGQHQRQSSYQHDMIVANGMQARDLRSSASYRCKSFIKAMTPKSIHTASSILQEKAENHAGHPEMRDNVVVEWTSGPLGLTLLEDAISGAPIVNRLTGKGSSANMERLQHGFQLYSVNGVKTEGRLLQDLHRDLLTLPKPLKLVFCPAHSNGICEKDSESHRKLSSLSSSSSIAPAISIQSDVELDEGAHRALVTAPVAQGRHSQQVPAIDEQYEYEVVWTSNRLGLQLEISHKPTKKDKADKLPTRRHYPIVRKILKESTLGLPSDAVGHLFVSINNWHTSGLSVEELRTLLGAASKPALLRFRRQDGLPDFQRTFLSKSSCGTDEHYMDRKATLGSAYSILWSKGKLGIVFGCYEDADCHNLLVVYVKSIGPGQARNSKFVAVGDILCSINGRNLPPKHSFKKTMQSLINISQPVTLGFRRLLVERCSDWN